MTLRMLAEHRTGLPRNPPAISRFARDPYLKFTNQALDSLLINLGSLRLVAPPGEFSYSNLGYCILGRIVEVATQLEWYQAVQQILFPKGEFLSPLGRSHFYHKGLFGRDIQPWTMTGPIKSAGGLWGTVRSTFNYVTSELAGQKVSTSPLGWQNSGPLIWHNGATRNASIFAAYLPEREIAIVYHGLNQRPNITDAKALKILHNFTLQLR